MRDVNGNVGAVYYNIMIWSPVHGNRGLLTRIDTPVLAL
jgi:hypothetical protein